MTTNIRLLTPREIECRVQQCKQNGLVLLLYKDARCDMAILDETFGSMNWQRHHSRDNANCIVSIWDAEKNQWIEKEDTGTESNTEAQKGLASDSFKRSCTNVGIGRELYTAPFIWVSSDKVEIKADNRGGYKTYERFDVRDIGYNQHREIVYLVIVDSKGKTVYTYGQRPAAEPAKLPDSSPAPAATESEQLELVKAIVSGVTDVDSANAALSTIVGMSLPSDILKEANPLLIKAAGAVNLVYSKSAKSFVRKG